MELSVEKKLELLHKQTYNVVKSNELIQKSRFALSLVEQKIVLRLIQMIQPQDQDFQEYFFDIQEFCDICGIDRLSGGNYSYIKDTLEKLADKKFWINFDDEKGRQRSTQCRWILKPSIIKNSGQVGVILDKDLKPYLLNLKENFTIYSLSNILSMKSKYSPRLYELMKSEQYKKTFFYNLQELKDILDANNYEFFGNFKQKVLDIAINEINESTDIFVKFEPIKTKRKYTDIKFTVRAKTSKEYTKVLSNKK